MPGEYGSQEVLAQGRDPTPRSHRAYGPWRRPHPVVTGVVVSLIAGAVLVGYLVTGPKLPQLTVAEAPLPSAGSEQVPPPNPWQPGDNGRPAGGVFLTIDARLSAGGSASGAVEVLGISGPGIVRNASPPFHLAADGRYTAGVLAADVDCTQVRLPLAPDAYRLRVSVVDGSRQVEGILVAGSLGRRWADSVQSACGSWLARQDLTVTQMSATVDALQARVDLNFTIANAGRNTAFLATTPVGTALAVSATPPGVIVVKPRDGARVSLRVDLHDCDAIPPLPPSDGGGVYGTTADVLGLLAMVGAPPDASGSQPPLDGLGPTGVVFGQGVASAVAVAMRSACGGLGPYVTLIAPNGVALDRRTGVVTIRIQLDSTPGRVKDLRLVSDSAPAGNPDVFTPLWGTSSTLVPDYTGQVTTTLRYQVPPSGRTCPSLGSWIPSFTVIAKVPVPGGIKTLRYTQLIDPLESLDAVRQLCTPPV